MPQAPSTVTDGDIRSQRRAMRQATTASTVKPVAAAPEPLRGSRERRQTPKGSMHAAAKKVRVRAHNPRECV
jgi:hypothetical protein